MEIKILHQVMDWNEDVSEEVKESLASHQICMINIMGSPGAGKTSLITSLIDRLKEGLPHRRNRRRHCRPGRCRAHRRPGHSHCSAQHGRRMPY